jgi:hypothetical protein
MDSPAVTPPRRPKPLRRKYLIDKPTQLRVMLSLVLGLAAIAVSFVGALVVYFSPDGDTTLTGQEVRALLLKVNWVYFGLAAVVLAELVLVLTHRFVGPAYVFRRALDGILAGRYDERLSLRKSDFLRDIAVKLTEVRDRWHAREDETSRACERIEECLAMGDVDGARSALAHLQRRPTPAREPAAPVRA